jgi:hypothetical protein
MFNKSFIINKLLRITILHDVAWNAGKSGTKYSQKYHRTAVGLLFNYGFTGRVSVRVPSSFQLPTS